MSSEIGAATSLGQASSRMRAASSASSLEPKKKPASAVTTIRNGNIAISVESAMWLAIAQPSSARKCQKASTTIRNDNVRIRKTPASGPLVPAEAGESDRIYLSGFREGAGPSGTGT